MIQSELSSRMLSSGRGPGQHSNPVMVALKTSVRCANDDMVMLSKVRQLFPPERSTVGCFLTDGLHGPLKKVYVSLPVAPLSVHSSALST